jgi:hypothetical protein
MLDHEEESSFINSLIIVFTDVIVLFVMPEDLNRTRLPAGRFAGMTTKTSRLL